MAALNVESIQNMMKKTQEPSISIFLPTYRKGSEAGQNAIRFKNLLRNVEKLLHEKGFEFNKIQEFLAEPFALLEDVDFWNHQLDGLAVFISPGEFQYFKLPNTVEEKFIVNDHYHLKPILNLLNGDMRFYIVAIDLHKTRLFKCSRYNIEEVNLGDTIVKFEDFQKFIVPASSQNKEGVGPVANTPIREGMLHGFGMYGEPERKKDIIEFFRLVDKGIKAHLKDLNSFLIPAGVEYLIPLYRESNTYTNLSPEAINKNPHTFSQEELLNEGWNIIKKRTERKTADALKQFGNLLNYDKASNDIKEVIKASHSNRILHLLVNFDGEIWGKFNPDTYDVELHTEKIDGDEELISLAVQQTLFHNGFVYPVNKEEMPNGEPLAAVFRY